MGWLADKNPQEAARIEAERRNSFEETVIKKLLALANVRYRLAASRADAASMNGGSHLLTFDWFMATYPRFPVYLGCAKVPYTHQISVGQLFGAHFMKLPFVAEYKKFLEQSGRNPLSDRTGLVFGWSGIDAGGTAMVLHNYPLNSHNVPDPDGRLERGTRIVRPFGNPVVVYVVEALSDLCISMGTDWAAE